MLLATMLACAVAAVLLIVLSAFTEFHDLWVHPRIEEENSRFGKPKLR